MRISIALAILSLALAASAQDANDVHKRPAPRLAIAVLTSKDAIDVTETVMAFVDQTIEREVLADGVIRKITEVEKVPVFERRVRHVDPSRITIVNVAGEDISRESLADLLRKPTSVLISINDPKIDPIFAEAFKPTTIVLVFPADADEAVQAQDSKSPRPVQNSSEGELKKESLDDPRTAQGLQEQQLAEGRAIRVLEQLTPRDVFRDKNQAGSPIVTIHVNGSSCSDTQLKELAELKSLRFLNLTSTNVTDAGLEHLADLTQLRRLYLADTSITGTGFRHLANCTKIEWLRLYDSQFTDEGLEYLSGFRQLTQLTLDGTRVTDAGLRHLAGLSNLHFLKLSRTQVSDAGMPHLASLTKLSNLYLDDTRVTDEGLQSLSTLTALTGLSIEGTEVTGTSFDKLHSLTQLKWLYADHTKFSDEGLAHLAHFPELNEVNLRDTQITDHGLSHLASLKKLQILRLDRSRVSDAAVKKLQQSLPKLNVDR